MAQRKCGTDVHADHRERMRARIAGQGLSGLHDHEVLEYLLYSYIPRRDTNPVAHELLNTFGGIQNVFGGDYNALMQVKGMTANAALFLSVLPEVFNICRKSEFTGRKVDNLSSLTEYTGELFRHMKQERVYMICVDRKGVVVALNELASGDADICDVSVKKLITLAVGSGVSNVYLAHNHPREKARPSERDKEFTLTARKMLDAFGIKLVDHLIISDNTYFSFALNGMMGDKI